MYAPTAATAGLASRHHHTHVVPNHAPEIPSTSANEPTNAHGWSPPVRIRPPKKNRLRDGWTACTRKRRPEPSVQGTASSGASSEDARGGGAGRKAGTLLGVRKGLGPVPVESRVSCPDVRGDDDDMPLSSSSRFSRTTETGECPALVRLSDAPAGPRRLTDESPLNRRNMSSRLLRMPPPMLVRSEAPPGESGDGSGGLAAIVGRPWGPVEIDTG